MTANFQVSEFFTAGGTLPPDAPSYVKRPTDDELFRHIMGGEFCYVLTPRQMGKSSLMIRTAQLLSKEGVKSAIVDLTQIGTVKSEDQWYKGILTQIARRLRLTTDPVSWWEQRKDIPNIQKFIEFFEDALSELKEPIVIFMDEIDTTLKLEFRDNFFAGVRALFNARAENPDLKRITFVLLGVASPSDLIKDRNRTPFNIGQEIPLNPFSRDDAHMLEKGLEEVYPKLGRKILDRIFYWTNGHPYLTQKICQSVVENRLSEYSDYEIDKLVEKLFITEEASRETNLQFVRDNILSYPERRVILSLYKKLLRESDVRDNKNSLPQNHLKLSGLACAEDGRLVVSNKIYRTVFDHKWVNKYIEVDWRYPIIGVLSLIIIGFLSVFYNEGVRLPDYAETRVKGVPIFRDDRGIQYLADLFMMDPLIFPDEYTYRAKDSFFNTFSSWEDQRALIEIAYGEPTPSPESYKIVIEGLYTSLADVDNSGQTTKLLDVMYKSLYEIGMKNDPVCKEIGFWLKARENASKNNFKDALSNYTDAINQNLKKNSAILFERARIYTELREYEKASNDYEEVIIISLESASAFTPTPVPTLTFTPTKTPILKPTLTSTSKATLLPTLTPTLRLTQTPGIRPTFSPSTQPSVTSILSPTLITSATRTMAPQSATSTLTPTNPPEPVRSRFSNSEQQFAAVRNEINQHTELLLFLLQNQDKYPNLVNNGMVPTLTPIPTNTQTPTSEITTTRTRRPLSSTETSTPSANLPPSPIPQDSILYQEDFEDGVADGWTSSTWTVVNENGNYIYRGTGPGDYPWSWLDENFIDMSNWTDYAFESKIRFTRGNVFVVARMINQTEYFYTAVINGDGFIDFGDWNVTKEGYTNSAVNATYPIQTNKWYTVRFELQGDLQTLYIDGELVLERQHSGRDSGGIGFYIVDTTVQGEEEEIYFDDIRVWSLTQSSTQTAPTERANQLSLPGSIFFASSRDGDSEIYRLDSRTGTITQITNNPALDSFPTVSPDGQRLCFETDRTGIFQIFCIDGNGNVFNLSNDSAEEGMPRFSPDGSLIAFHRRETISSSWEIWVMNADGTNKRRLTFENTYMGEPAWFPDGKKLAFDGDKPDRNILTINLDGSGLSVINDEFGEQRSPSVSPDGQYIYYDSGETGLYQIYRMRVDGSEQTALTNGDFDNVLPQLSPDGNWLIFSSNRDNGDWELYLSNSDGTDIQRVTMSSGTDDTPSWANP